MGVAIHNQGGRHGDGHPHRGDQVAAHRGLGPGQAHQPVDEQRERDDVEDRDQVVHRPCPSVPVLTGPVCPASPWAAARAASSPAGAGFLPLNMPSMRSVTMKPPMTFSVPKTSATNRMICNAIDGCSMRPSSTSAPRTTMPWMALVPDISGVCSVLGTLEITAKPTNPASTRIARLARSSSYI